ncbi:MAG: PAS domain S-box protein, partial [Anaerolineae bacterium]|nr:PAS domain S-box protein [Anaerolineae bacterium]
NRHWAEMLGYEEEEVYRLDLWDVTLPEERELSRRKLRMLAAREIDGYTLEKRYIRKDGSTMWARVSVSPILDENDRLETVVAMITDITERKQAEQAVHASETRYRSLFEDMPIGLFELDFSAVKTALEDLQKRYAIFDPRDYFYGNPAEVMTCLDKLRILNVNRAALTLFEANGPQAMVEHLLRSLKAEAFEDFRLILINLAENKLSTTLEAMLQTVNGNQRSVSLHITVMPQYEDNWARVLIAVQDITARLEAQLALRESEERYRRLFEDVPISLWEEDFSRARRFIQHLQTRGVTDIGAHFAANPEDLIECIAGIHVLDVNSHTLQLYHNTNKEDFLGSLGRIVPADEYDVLQDELVALANGQYEISLESNRLISGTSRYMAINLSVAPGYEATWGRVLVSLTDITRLKEAEAAEHEQRTLAEALRDTAAALVGSLDPEIVLNRILDNLGQVVPHDAANIGLVEGNQVRIHSWRGYHDLMGVEDLRLPLNYPTFQQMYHTGEPLLISDVSQDQDWIDAPGTMWVKSYVGVPVRAHGQVVGFLNLDSEHPGFFTEEHVGRLQAFADQAAIAIENAQLYDEIRKHADELQHRVEQRTLELEHERAQLQAILDAMGEGVVYTENNTIRYVNDQIVTMLGYDQMTLQGDVNEVLVQAMQFQNLDITSNWEELLRILNRRRIWRGDARVTRQDGSTFDASLTVTLVGNPGEQPISIVTIVRDVSQERALEAQKDRFIANASHELRTPIANMKMRLYLLEKQPTRQAEHMEVLHYVAGRMGTLVEELLDVSRFERGVISLDRQVVDLRTLIEHVVAIEQPIIQEKGLTLVHRLPPEALDVNIDSNRITQVLNNLLANAANYTLEGGQITVEATREEDEAVVRVSDTGIGIPAEALEQIFEPFYRVNEAVARGTGLGLTISREIVDLHGGALTVESELDKGSTFTLRLPLHRPKAE